MTRHHLYPEEVKTLFMERALARLMKRLEAKTQPGPATELRTLNSDRRTRNQEHMEFKDVPSGIILKALGLTAGTLAAGAALALFFWMAADAINAWMIVKWGL